jgi:hypothetical protein
MRLSRRWGLVFAAAPWVLVVIVGPGTARSRSPGPAALGGQPAVAGRLLGSGSCSGTACHGGIAPARGARIFGNEHATWITNDPHARAFQVLFNARSQQIARNLAAGRSSWTPAHEESRCLACHATPRRAEDLEATAWMNEDGVGCESCHGAASGWIGPHTTAGWDALDGITKERQYGLSRTKSLARRAEVCAGCHVGRRDDPTGVIDRDMNHDLIAAGHPRLNFEFAAYQANEPPHWVEKGRNDAADFPARAWAIGQVATAKAAAELLRGRAADRSAPWPEFSESNCYDCHHTLADQRWRQVGDGSGTGSGIPAWGSWYTPLTRALAAELGQTAPAEAYEPLIAAMGRALPSRDDAARRAGQVASALDRWLPTLESAPMSRAEVARLFDAINAPAAWEQTAGWDGAAQRYLALVPLHQALGRFDGAPDTAVSAALDRILKALAFPEGEDGPGRTFDPAQLPSP